MFLLKHTHPKRTQRHSWINIVKFPHRSADIVSHLGTTLEHSYSASWDLLHSLAQHLAAPFTEGHGDFTLVMLSMASRRTVGLSFLIRKLNKRFLLPLFHHKRLSYERFNCQPNDPLLGQCWCNLITGVSTSQVWGDGKQADALRQLGRTMSPGSLWQLGRNLLISDIFPSATQFGKTTQNAKVAFGSPEG